MKPSMAFSVAAALILGFGSGLFAGEWIPASLGSLEDFQKAMKARDGEAMWQLLTVNSQMAADTTAKSLAEAYQKGSPEEKTKIENALGLNATAMAQLDAKKFMTTKLFLEAYAYLASKDRPHASMVEGKAKVSLTWKSATREDLVYLRRGKDETRYKLDLPMPSIP